MLEFVARRLLHAALVTVGVVTLVFIALRLSGDPAASMLPGDASVDELADLRRDPQSTLLDADGSLWRLLDPNGLDGKYWIGSQPGHRFHDAMEQARDTLDARKRGELYLEATRIVHEDKPWLELFQEVVLYGVSKRVTLKPRADYRLLAAELTLAR